MVDVLKDVRNVLAEPNNKLAAEPNNKTVAAVDVLKNALALKAARVPNHVLATTKSIRRAPKAPSAAELTAGRSPGPKPAALPALLPPGTRLAVSRPKSGKRRR